MEHKVAEDMEINGKQRSLLASLLVIMMTAISFYLVTGNGYSAARK